MDEQLIHNWNKEVPENGIVFHLGDFSFGYGQLEILQKLNGTIHLILGNHDKRSNFESYTQGYNSAWKYPCINDVVELEVGKINATLFHYPMVVWNKAHHGAYQFFGHVHNSMDCKKYVKNSWNVGIDVNDYRPITLKEACRKAKENSLDMS